MAIKRRLLHFAYGAIRLPNPSRDMNNDAKPRSPADVQRLLELIDAFAAEMSPRGHKLPAVRLDSDFERDLGLDSVARTELLTRVEKALAIRFPLESFGQAVTPADLLRVIDGTVSGRSDSPVRTIELDAPGGALDPPTDARTLVEALQWHASRRPRRTHVVFLAEDEASHAMTYAALHEAALRVSSGLRRIGVNPGDTVALMLPTGRRCSRVGAAD